MYAGTDPSAGPRAGDRGHRRRGQRHARRQLLGWAREWPERAWAIEGAAGLGCLLAQQLVAAGERVVDVPPKLAARVRLLASGNTGKNDPDDAYSVAVAALPSKAWRPVVADGQAVVLKVWGRRHRDLARSRNQACCRLHAALRAGPRGYSQGDHRSPGRQDPRELTPSGPAAKARRELAAEFLAGIRRLDAQLRECSKKLAAAVKAPGTSLTGLFGVGPVIAGTVAGDVRQVFRFPGRDHFASWNGTAPVEVSPGDRKRIRRLPLRGSRRVNHAIHMAAISQIRHQRSDGRAFYEKKTAEGKTHKEALRSLKRRISDAIYAALAADARQATACPKGPGGQPGNHFASRAAGSHPARRRLGKPLPGLATTLRPRAASRAGPSPVAANLPPAKPRVQVETSSVNPLAP